MSVKDVLDGTAHWGVDCCDVLPWLRSLPADSVDLIFGSPPYELARLYLEGGKNIGIARKTEAWVSWMVDVYRECVRVCRGLVAFVVEGQTRNYRYSAGPALLMADLHRAGFNLRKPPVFHRVGIPGSGGPDWLRNDWEWIICVSRPGKLPWSDNTACGHPPKWAPGGEMSHRLTDGQRINQWGKTGANTRCGAKSPGTKPLSLPGSRPSHANGTVAEHKARRATSGHKNGDTQNGDSYLPPVLANPGNVIHCKVGGGLMGSQHAHENEAPFPEKLADFFTLSFCPPGGVVADPFAGSGTTLASALKHGRRAIGCDLRESQVALTKRRIATVQPVLMQ